MRFGGLIAAIVFAAIAAVVVLRMSAEQAQAPVVAPQAIEQKTLNVYVAARPIALGATISADMLAAQPWPEQLALPSFVIADGKTNVVGSIARAPFQQNEPIIQSKLANPSDPNFLAGDLPKGQRVVTIAVNETDGVAGFVFPGDRVDVIYTHDVEKTEYTPAASATDPNAVSATKTKETVSETLLTNVKVVAIDQRASGGTAVDANGNLLIPRSASLMVSQADAQRIRLAAKTGTLSLALRALEDRESADPLLLTTKGDVSQSVDNAAPPARADSGIKIVRGAPSVVKETESNSIPQTNVGAPPIGTVINPNLAARP